MLTNIMYVTVYVTDQDRALEFYAGGLGLEKHVDHRGPDGRFLTVGVPGGPVKIILWAHADAAALSGAGFQAGARTGRRPVRAHAGAGSPRRRRALNPVTRQMPRPKGRP